MWRGPERLWSYSFENERSPQNALGLSGFVTDPARALELLEWGGKHFDFADDRRLLPYFLRSLYRAPASPAEKIRIYRECFFEHPLYKAYFGLALLRGSGEEAARGRQLLAAGLAGPLPGPHRAFVETEVRRLCGPGPEPRDCGALMKLIGGTE
jgi:hypothetical protein